MTKTLRFSLVAFALASTGLLTIESASAAMICRGGLIISAKCLNPANANSPLCQCNSSNSSDARGSNLGSGNGSGGGTIPDSDTPPDDTPPDGDEEPVDQ